MRVKEQFNKYAHSYQDNSIIQQKGVELLVKSLPKKLGVIIDLGCGDGRLYKTLVDNGHEIDKFYGVDFAPSMLNSHPKSKGIELMCSDFNTKSTFESLKAFNADTLLSASALQWSNNIESTLRGCATVAPFGAFFIFCSGTFKTLHHVANTTSPIYSETQIKEAFLSAYRALNMQTLTFRLPFNSNMQMLQYIKQSGVSGNLQLSYTTLKRVLNEYPLGYLEFETLLLIGESK